MSTDSSPSAPKSLIARAADAAGTLLGLAADRAGNSRVSALETGLEAARSAEKAELSRLDSDLAQLEARFAESGSAELAGQVAEREAVRAKVAGWHAATIKKLEASLDAAKCEARAQEADRAARFELNAIVERAKARSALVGEVAALCSRLEPIVTQRSPLDPEAEARLKDLLATELPTPMAPFFTESRLDDVPLASLDAIESLRASADRLYHLSLRMGELFRQADAARSVRTARIDRETWAAKESERKKLEKEAEQRRLALELQRHPEQAIRSTHN